MNIRVCPYAAEHEDAVRAFNARLATANVDPGLYSSRFPEQHLPTWLPRLPGCDLYQEFYVAVDDESQVRGAYILKRQPFYVGGQIVQIADFQLPISEGIIDDRFMTVAVRLYMDAIRREPRLFGLGGGGYHVPVVKFLLAAGCQTALVPFYFRVVRSSRFLKNITVLRTSRMRAAGFDFLAWSGLGWLGIQTIKTIRPKYRCPPSVTYERVDEFGDWADDIWNDSKADYSLMAVRDRQILNVLYPSSKPKFIRLKISRGGKPIGWAVLLNTQMARHKQFGDMRVGSLIDCLAKADNAPDVVACARDYLEAEGVDLIVSNQASEAWCRALHGGGFLRGPSNLPFMAAPRLAALVPSFQEASKRFHLNRGDGDGPIHL